MKVLLVLAACVAVTLASHGDVIFVKEGDKTITLQEYYNQTADIDERIIAGTAATAGQFPWMVAVRTTRSGGTSFCGGALISNIWVLTAAHCVTGAVQSVSLQVGGITSGASETGRVTVAGAQIIIHAQYNANNLNNDVAVIRLASAVTFNARIQAIRLPAAGESVPAGVTVRVSGWGRTSDSATGISSQLMWVDLTTITNAQCASVYGSSTIINSVVCAVGNPHHSTCNGDSGGPLIRIQNGVATHVGVVSFVHRAGCASGNPSGYVRTASMLTWIANQTGVGA